MAKKKVPAESSPASVPSGEPAAPLPAAMAAQQAMAAAMAGVPPGMMPGGGPAAVPGAYGMPWPGAMPGMAGMMPGTAPAMAPPGGMPWAGNQMMFVFMQMMQSMMGGMGMVGAIDPAAVPFGTGQAKPDTDRGLDADIIRPALLTDRVRAQQAMPLGSVLDLLCLTEDAQHALGGIPKGCTMAFAGPPGKGKTRTALAGVAQVAARGEKVAFVVAEEGFHDETGSGRDDLCSRLVRVGMIVTGLDEATFTKQVLENIYVMECQYHKGTSWDDFVGKYRYLVEKEKISFVVIDSLNMLDPTKNRTADNLSALKTYNHAQGITCLCLGQIRDTGMPVGGEALQHTADAVFLIEEMTLGSKEIADLWGAKYRDRIDIITVVKSVTTPRFEYPIRVARAPGTGVLVVHESQPADYKPLPPRQA